MGLKKVWVKKARFKKTKAPKNLVQKVWPRSVRTEIFLIWTIVARTNVAWTNVNITVEICSRGFQEPTISWIEVESVLSDLTHF